LGEHEIVEEIKKICFAQDIGRRSILHDSLIDDLFDLLRNYNYYVIAECPIVYTHLSRKGITSRRQGYMDLLAIGYNHRISIEFDSGITLKYKSIEKLLQSDVDIRIGIVRGKRNNAFLLQDNSEKIYEVAGYSQIFDKKLLLIIIFEGICKEMPFTVRK